MKQERITTIEQKIAPLMVDPSIFLPDTASLQAISHFGDVYIPGSIIEATREDFAVLLEFYFPYLSIKEMPPIELIINQISRYESVTPFRGEKFLTEIPEIFRERSRNLAALDVPPFVKEILMDEYVFLCTQSCLLSRLKKVFKQFEKANVLPLINLEKIVPPEWQETISGLKHVANWVGFIGGFTITFGPSIGIPVGLAVAKGVRLFIIDP